MFPLQIIMCQIAVLAEATWVMWFVKVLTVGSHFGFTMLVIAIETHIFGVSFLIYMRTFEFCFLLFLFLITWQRLVCFDNSNLLNACISILLSLFDDWALHFTNLTLNKDYGICQIFWYVVAQILYFMNLIRIFTVNKFLTWSLSKNIYSISLFHFANLNKVVK